MPRPQSRPALGSSRATISDVARMAGVHASTVSRALNPATREMVTDAVVSRVAAAADQLGWRPSVLAAGLRTRRSRTVAILVPDLVNPIFPPIVRAAETRLAEAGYVALVANTDNDPAREAMLIDRMAGHLVDGLMLASAATGSEALTLCAHWRIPAVLINRRIPGAEPSAVANDDRLGMRLAVAHLASLGHRRIAHLGGPRGVSTAADRHAGFLAGLDEAGLDPGVAAVVAADGYTIAAGRVAMRTLLRGGSFTAVAVANDLLCLGAYDALAEVGLRVGADISLTGFNDMPFVDRVSPPLTTVRIQHAEMGHQGARLLLDAIADPDAPSQQIVLRPELVLRASTAPVR